MDGRNDGETERRKIGRIDGGTDGRNNGEIDGESDGWTEERTDRLVEQIYRLRRRGFERA
jgi:hypothetical protein